MIRKVGIGKIILSLSLLYVCGSLVLPSIAIAVTPEQRKVIDSGITDFNTERDDVGQCAASGTVLSGSENRIKVWNFLVTAPRSLTPPQAAGIMGNLQAESHFDPAIEQVKGAWQNMNPSVYHQAVGLVQWDGGRRVAIVNAAKAQNKDPKDLAFQLEYMYQEALKRGDWDRIKQTTTAADSAFIWHKYYEVSADGPERIQGRINNANAILAELGSTTPDVNAVPASGDNSCGGSSTSASSIVQAALLYSWPEKGHGLTPKPEYAAAIAKYNRGAPFAGADCGAFVGTVMIATGADPDYPPYSTPQQEKYVRAHPEKYQIVPGITTNADISKLQPGDILIVNKGSGQGADGHTLIFVGPQEPKKFNQASASGGSRMPNLGNAEIVDSLGRGVYTVARLK